MASRQFTRKALNHLEIGQSDRRPKAIQFAFPQNRQRAEQAPIWGKSHKQRTKDVEGMDATGEEIGRQD